MTKAICVPLFFLIRRN